LSPGESTVDAGAFEQHDSVMQLHEACEAGKPEKSAGQHGPLPGMRGWLLAYVVVLAYLLLHGAGLTIASIVIYAHPAAAGLRSFVPLSFLLFYVITNVILIFYMALLFVLMARRRKSAIINNIVFNILSVMFLVAWHILGEKSNAGTVVDSVPNLAGAAYFLLSRRVRNTFVIGSKSLLSRMTVPVLP
jgi:hypothetical protein